MFKQIFTRSKYDGVVDAVHYAPDGQIEWVRAYERRGPTWSDHVLLDRETLIARLKNGRRFYFGERHEFMASEFNVSVQLRLAKNADGDEIVLAGDKQGQHDDLGPVPVI